MRVTRTAVVLGVVLAGLAGRGWGDGPKEALTAGEAAPKMVLRNLAGDYVYLSHYAGAEAKPKTPRVVVLNFWATTCEPCLKEMPHLLQVVGQKDAAKVVGFLVSEDGVERAEAVRSAAAQTGMPTDRVLMDPYGVAGKKFIPSQRIPMTFVVRPDGRIAAVVPFREDAAAYAGELGKAIDEAVAQAGI